MTIQKQNFLSDPKLKEIVKKLNDNSFKYDFKYTGKEPKQRARLLNRLVASYAKGWGEDIAYKLKEIFIQNPELELNPGELWVALMWVLFQIHFNKTESNEFRDCELVQLQVISMIRPIVQLALDDIKIQELVGEDLIDYFANFYVEMQLKKKR